jgi:hypothetical protein
VHRGVYSLVIEQGVTRLRYAREETRASVEAGIEEECRGERKVRVRRASSARVGVVVYEEPPEPRNNGAVLSAERTRAGR